MGRRSTYGEVKQRGKNLARETVVRKQAEDALRESEKRYQNLVESVRDVIYTLSEEGAFTSLNSAFESISGWSRKEWIGRPLQSLVHPDDWPGELAFLELMLRGETPPTHEVRVRAKSGEYLVVESIVTPRFQGGKLVGVLGVARDITERKKAEEALQKSEERYRTILESIEEGYFEVDLAGNLTFFNDSTCTISGYYRNELMGMNNRDYTTPETAQRMYGVFKEIYRTEKPARIIDYEIIRKDGKAVVLEMSASLMRDRAGNPIGFRGVVRDITARKRVEEALRESEEKYRDLVENMSEVIYTLDNKRVMTYISPAIESFMGYSPSEIIGRPFTEFIYGEDLPGAKRRFSEVLSGNLGLSEYRVVNKSGDMRWILVSSKPTVMKNVVTGVRGVLTDITERKRAEESLRESEERYRELADSIADVFFAMDKELKYTYWNQASENLTGIPAKEALGKSLLEIFPDTPQTRKAQKVYSDVLRTQRSQSFVNEYQLRGKDFFFEISAYPSSQGVSVFVRDITERKRAEQELELKTRNLEEANAALNVLLKRRDEDKRELEEKVLFNMKELALPYVGKLKASGLNERQISYLSILESNLEEIISPFSYRLSSRYLNLTPAEIEVANLIKQGKTSKEIAEFLNVSTRTISFHRANLREKIEIKNKKANLRARLLSLH